MFFDHCLSNVFSDSFTNVFLQFEDFVLAFFRQLNPKALKHWRRLLSTKEQQNDNDL